MSLGGWLREQDALPAVHRRHELASLSLSCDGPERTSLLARAAQARHARRRRLLRPRAVGGPPRRRGLGGGRAARWPPSSARRVRLGAVVRGIDDRAPAASTVTLADGEAIARRGGRLRDPRRPAARGRDRRPQRRSAALAALAAPRARGQGRRRLRGVVLAAPRVRTGSPRPSGCSARHGPRATACCRCWSRPSGFGRSWRRPHAASRRDGARRTGGAVRRARRGSRSDARARVGRRPVHARLHLELGARRSDARRAAARDPRAAVLRRRLGPLGGRLHGGRGPHRTRRRRARPCARARLPDLCRGCAQPSDLRAERVRDPARARSTRPRRARSSGIARSPISVADPEAVDQRQRAVGDLVGVAAREFAVLDAGGDLVARTSRAGARRAPRRPGAARDGAPRAATARPTAPSPRVERRRRRQALIDHRPQALGVRGRRQLAAGDPGVAGVRVGVVERLREQRLAGREVVVDERASRRRRPSRSARSGRRRCPRGRSAATAAARIRSRALGVAGGAALTSRRRRAGCGGLRDPRAPGRRTTPPRSRGATAGRTR